MVAAEPSPAAEAVATRETIEAGVEPVDLDRIEAIAARLDLREPNKEALRDRDPPDRRALRHGP